MKSLFAALILCPALAFAAAPAQTKPTAKQRAYSKKMKAKRARMAKICHAQGPTCHVPSGKDEPRDLMGVSCICD